METIKEAAKEYAINRHGKDESWSPDRQEFVTGFIQGVVWSERWIPVEEELPPIGENITILLKGEGENGKETFNFTPLIKLQIIND